MRNHQVQKLYLEIQSRLGELLDAAPDEEKKPLQSISTELCRIKRRWIGVVDEIEADIG